MIARLVDWLTDRAKRRYGTDEVRQRAETRLDHIERVVIDQEMEVQRVNMLYDRITGRGVLDDQRA